MSFQVIAVVCGGLSILLLIISIASTAWLEADMYRQGLWEECDTLENGDVDCRKNETTGNFSVFNEFVMFNSKLRTMV